MVAVRAGGLVFEGGAGQDGFYIEDKGLQGLLSGVDVRSNDVPRPDAHGDFVTPGFLEARIVSWSGPVIAPSLRELLRRGRQLTGLLAGGLQGRVMFDLPSGPLWGNGQLAMKTEFDPDMWEDFNGSMRSPYSVSLKFANPRLFGETRLFGAAGNVFFLAHHYGNFPAAPVFTVTGDMPNGYWIYGPNDKVFAVIAPVVPGVPHVIDMATGYLTVGGVVTFGKVTVADTWTVPSGGVVSQIMIPVAGSGNVGMAVPDTFV